MTCWVSSEAAQQPQLVLFTAVRDYLVDLSRQRPIALFLDDLHWADPASIARGVGLTTKAQQWTGSRGRSATSRRHACHPCCAR